MALRVSLIVLLTGARGVVGWGAVGHRTVGALALKHMSPTALIEADRLLGCTWMDSIRSAYSGYGTWHYYDGMFFLPTQPNNPKLPPPNGDMLSAISNALSGLMSPTSRPANVPTLAYPPNMPSWDHARATWLRILLHLIGDMHQPLHCAGLCGAAPYASLPTGDAGGNFIKLATATNSRGYALHGYWDGGANLFSTMGIPNTTTDTNAIVAIVAAQIDNGEVQRIASTAMPANLASLMMSVLQWSNESLALARGVAYSAPVDTAVKAGSTNVLTDGTNAAVFDDYQVRAQPVVMMQLQRAGGRLAALLNAVLTADLSPTPSDNVANAPTAAPVTPDPPAAPVIIVPPPPAPGSSASTASTTQQAPACSPPRGSNAVMAAAVIGWLVAIVAAIVTARLLMKQPRTHVADEDRAPMLEMPAPGTQRADKV